MALILGDMNAKIGTSMPGGATVTGQHGLGVRNDNGCRLVESCQKKFFLIRKSTKAHEEVPRDQK